MKPTLQRSELLLENAELERKLDIAELFIKSIAFYEVSLPFLRENASEALAKIKETEAKKC